MQKISFRIQGSADEPYKVVFIKQSDMKLSAHCSCPAGKHGQCCKHRFNIFDGLTKGIVSGNLDDIKVVQSWFEGTDVESALIKMRELDIEAKKINKALSDAKKDVAMAMYG